MDSGTLKGFRPPALWLQRAKPACANAIANAISSSEGNAYAIAVSVDWLARILI